MNLPDVDDSIDSGPFEMELEDTEYPLELRITANPWEKLGYPHASG